MDRELDVVVLGDINIDLVFLVEEAPKPGGMSVAEDYRESHGGVGGNIASALARLGLKVGLIGAVGDDVFGARALRALKEREVDTERVRVLRKVHTGLMSIAVDRAGERAIVGSRGANAQVEITREDEEYLSSAKHLHVSGYQMLNRDGGAGALSLLRAARKMGLSTSMDMEGAAFIEGVAERVKGLLTHVFANRWEAGGFTGVEDEEEMVRRLRRMLDADVAAVKLGGRGSIVDWRDGTIHLASFKVEAVDSTGAGDAFNAGFIYGVLRRLSPRESGILGNAMGAYKCMGVGARHHPTLKELSRTFPKVAALIQL